MSTLSDACRAQAAHGGAFDWYRAQAGFCQEFVGESSCVSRVGYDVAHQTMCVELVSGKCYLYHDVPNEVYIELWLAKSTGSKWNTTVKGRFGEERL